MTDQDPTPLDTPTIMHVRLLGHYHVHPTGDYWPGEAENLLGNISEEQRQAGRKGNKGSLTAGGKPRAKSAKVTIITSHCSPTVESVSTIPSPASLYFSHWNCPVC